MEKVHDETMSGVARAEYIEVESNIRLHVTDEGEGRPIVLLPGWPFKWAGRRAADAPTPIGH